MNMNPDHNGVQASVNLNEGLWISPVSLGGRKGWQLPKRKACVRWEHLIGWKIRGSKGCWCTMRVCPTQPDLATLAMSWDGDCCVNRMICTTRDLQALLWRPPERMSPEMEVHSPEAACAMLKSQCNSPQAAH